jgi:Phage integrase, N-terminal SAM-like domain
MDAAKGSIRQRGTNSYELRVYGGTDPVSGRRRWLTRTVRGDRSDALRELKALAVHANIAPAVGAHTTIAALLDQWFARGRASWSPTTVRNLTSIVERHLKPGLGDILVGDLTTAIVDGVLRGPALRRPNRRQAPGRWHCEAHPLSATCRTGSSATLVLGLRERRRPRNSAQR